MPISTSSVADPSNPWPPCWLLMTLPHKSFVRQSPARSRGVSKNQIPQVFKGKDTFCQETPRWILYKCGFFDIYHIMSMMFFWKPKQLNFHRRPCLPGDPCGCFHFVQGIICFGREEFLRNRCNMVRQVKPGRFSEKTLFGTKTHNHNALRIKAVCLECLELQSKI